MLYHKYAQPKREALKKYGLLDLIHANQVLKLDAVSELLNKYQLSRDKESLIRRQINALKKVSTQEKLEPILNNSLSESALKWGLVKLIFGLKTSDSRERVLLKFLNYVSRPDEFTRISNRLKADGLLEFWTEYIKEINVPEQTWSLSVRYA